MAAMRVTEETPTKLVLETNTPQNEETSRQGLGCSWIVFGITIAIIVAFLMFGYPSYHTLNSWLFWVISIGGLLLEAFIIYTAIFVSQVVKVGVEKAAVNIDLQAQQAVRVETLRSGRVQSYELKLDEVSRVLVCREELGHSCKVLLDSQNGSHIEVNSDMFFETEPMKAFATKLGDFLKKPVVLKMMDQGNINSMSEEMP